MLNLTRDHLTSVIAENLALFSEFPVAVNYCNTKDSHQSSENYLLLVNEIKNNQDLRNILKKCLHSDFEINNKTHEFSSGFELSFFIKNNSIEISEGEDSWISNLERVKLALDGGACCSTRNSLIHEGDACYSDLINQCNSDWIFIKNLKKFLNADTISFRLPDNTVKNV